MEQGARDNIPPGNLLRGGKYYQGKGSVLEPTPHIFERCYPWVFKSVIINGEKKLTVSAALEQCKRMFINAHTKGGRVWIVGNGGSAAIASHLAVDLTKNGGIRAMAFNDAAMLTCFGNDFGYDQVFEKQIEYQVRDIDVMVIISTSGKSPNILSAANAARTKGCSIVTLSGMNPNNVLRQKGDINFYVPCTSYGIVETAHMILMHSIVPG